MVELTLYHGDCLQIMKELPAQSVDLIICDLPYGCLVSGKSSQWDIKINLEEFWKEVRRIRKNDHTPCIHFCTTKFGFELFQSNPKEFRYDLVWDKQQGVSFLSANIMPMRSHELIYVFSKAGSFYQRVDITGDFKKWKHFNLNVNAKTYNISSLKNIEGGDGTRCVLSVIPIRKKNYINKKHPTEKPNDLYQWLIERYCPVGGTVLDPTFGSGNSVFTAYQLGRNAIGIEKDDAFFKQAEERMETI